jgi:hypothetical protein
MVDDQAETMLISDDIMLTRVSQSHCVWRVVCAKLLLQLALKIEGGASYQACIGYM